MRRPFVWIPTLCALLAIAGAAPVVRGGCWLQPACQSFEDRGPAIPTFLGTGRNLRFTVGALLQEIDGQRSDVTGHRHGINGKREACGYKITKAGLFESRTKLDSLIQLHVPMVAQQHGPRNPAALKENPFVSSRIGPLRPFCQPCLKIHAHAPAENYAAEKKLEYLQCDRPVKAWRTGINQEQAYHASMVAQQHGPRNEDGGVRSKKENA